MRALIQRVSQASVESHGELLGSIHHGLLVLTGFESADTPEDLAWTAGKLVRLRIFNDDQGVMNRSVQEVAGGLLIVSQFTLHASTKKGNRPSYQAAAPPPVAIPLYEQFLKEVTREFGRPIQTGRFGADMQIQLVNDGPVTIWIDSKNRE